VAPRVQIVNYCFELSGISRNHHVNVMIFGKAYFTQNVCFDFRYTIFFSEGLFNQRRMKYDTNINPRTSSCKLLLLTYLNSTLFLSRDFGKNPDYKCLKSSSIGK
jgi:hypothetical protein